MDEPTQSSQPDSTDVSAVDSTPLDLDDLFDVTRELIPVAANWKSIGIALRLKRDALDYIESGNPGDRLTSVVTEWLKRNYNVKKFGEPTWRLLVEAVGDPAGGNNMALARNIARRNSGTNEIDMGEMCRKRKAGSTTKMPATKKAKFGGSQQSSDRIPPQTPDSKSQSSNTGADDTSESQPATTTVNKEYAKEIRKLARRSPLVLVTVGIPGAGKSTLINNLLGLKGNKAAETKYSRMSVTEHVDYYEGEVHGIAMCIIDTPGLEAMDLSSKEEEVVLATLSVLTDRKADILLYCMKLTDGSNYRDERIVTMLTKTFGEEIWKHTILVLTFGDVVLRQDEEDRDRLEEFIEGFGKALTKAGVSGVPVKSVLSTQSNKSDHEVQYPAIIGVPVGRHTQTPPNWTDLLFKEIIKKCKYDTIPAILMLRGIAPEWVAKILRPAGSLVGSVSRGVVGSGIVGMCIGAAIGAILGVPAPAVGAAIGGIAAGMVVGSASTIRYIDEQAGFAKISKARERVEKLKQKRRKMK